MNEIKKSLQQIKIDKKAQALRENLRKRKSQQRARQDHLDPVASEESTSFFLCSSLSSISPLMSSLSLAEQESIEDKQTEDSPCDKF